MQIGLGIGIPFTKSQVWLAVQAVFTPAKLFDSGANGLWLDPSDLTTMFQDSAGTTPVTAVEQPVGVIRDKSGRNNHAFQSTSANRPTLSARYNLLTKTEQFDDVFWSKYQTSIDSTTIAAPNGALTAKKVVASTTTDYHFISPTTNTNVPVANYTYSVYAKKAEYDRIYVYITVASVANSGVWFNLSNGTKGAEHGGRVGNIVDVGNGWFKCSVTWAVTGSSNTVGVCVSNSETYSYPGDGTSGVYIWGASLVPANQSSLPYQRVNTATDYDSDATKFPWYLKFNGTSSSLQTASTNFTATDKMFVSAGVRKLSDAATSILTELSANTNTNNGSFFVTAPENTLAAGNYGSLSHGTASIDAQQAAKSTVILSPSTSVLTATHDIAGDLSALRINGSANGTNGVGDKGTGNFGNYPLYIGARAGTSLFFNGYLYQLVIAGKQASNEEITSTETYINSNTKAY